MRRTSSLPNSAPDSSDQPYGGIVDETGEVAGTPVIEATYSDFIQSLWQFFRVTSTIPNGLAESTTNGFQLFQAMEEYLCPVGTIKIWPSTSVPSGWLLCNGATINAADYPDLYSLIGTTFNYGTLGAGLFKVPNLKDRMPVGKGSSFSIFASVGGEINHTLAISEIPSHFHNNGVADDKVVTFVYGSTSSGMPGSATRAIYDESGSATYQGKTSSAGSGGSHNNMPPYVVLNFIIKAKYGKDI